MGAYISSNGGQNWAAVNNGLGSTSIVITMAVIGNTLFAGTTTGVYKTTDNGSNWTLAINGLTTPYTLYLYPVGTNLFSGSWQGGVFLTTDMGANWTPVSTGLTNLDDRALTLYGSDLYVAAVGGVWKRPIGEMVGVNKMSNEVPKEFSLYQNYPNPFNPSTTIKFDIPASFSPLNEKGAGGFVTLSIYNVLGDEVAKLVNQNMQPGHYEITWNALNFSSGAYFYKLSAGDFTQTKQMILVK
jgi:hypothetical protein